MEAHVCLIIPYPAITPTVFHQFFNTSNHTIIFSHLHYDISLIRKDNYIELWIRNLIDFFGD